MRVGPAIGSTLKSTFDFGFTVTHPPVKNISTNKLGMNRLISHSQSVFPALAQDVRVRFAPDLIIPISDGDTFGLGGGGSFVMDMDFFDFLAP